MTENVGTQKISPSKIEAANMLRSQLINSEEEGADSRRIFSEMGTIPCEAMVVGNQGTASDYIHTDDEQSNKRRNRKSDERAFASQ